jgi:tRNA(fMet)-specific endonuclease VapC
VTQLLLDTTFLVDAARVGEELDDLVDDHDDVAVAAVTIAELRVGVLLAGGRRQAARAALVDDLVSSLPILGYDVTTASAHAELLVAVRRQGRPRGAHDLIIAATALSTGRTVVTADVTAFSDLPDVRVRSH